MSALLDTLLDGERRAEIARNEWTTQCRSPGSCRNHPPCSNCTDEHWTARVVRGEPYYWPIKHLQSDEEAAAAKARRARPPQERRSVRDSRFDNLMPK